MNKKRCGIYKIVNKITGGFYIGSSSDIPKRLSRHRRMLINNSHDNPHLQNSWNKYGMQAFVFEIVLLCDIENKLYYEQALIDGLKPKYNIAVCAEASQQGSHPSAATRAKLSTANKGQRRTLETRLNISKATKGKHKSEAHKQKLSELNEGELHPMFGTHQSAETRAKISEAAKGNTRCSGYKNALGYKHTEETRRQISEAAKRQWAKRRAEAQAQAFVWDRDRGLQVIVNSNVRDI